MSPKCPLQVFATECMLTNPKGPLLHFSALCDFFEKEKEKISSFFRKNVLRFLSLRYSADFRHSRLIYIFSKIDVFNNVPNFLYWAKEPNINSVIIRK